MRIPIVSGLILAIPLSVAAGEIYGTARPAGPGLEITVTCGPHSQSFFADPRGSYRNYLPWRGDCQLTARRGSGPWTDPLHIYLSERPTRYDFVINGQRLERR